MKAKYLKVDNNFDFCSLKNIGSEIKNGKLVVFPTETVYGIGTNGLEATFCSKIYEAKGRNPNNPLILHISNLDMLKDISNNISTLERKLIDRFFPGPFTIILNKSDIVPNMVTANLDTVAVRMPKNLIAKKLIDYAGVPIAAPSANISGKPSGTNIEDIITELGDKVDYIIDDGFCDIGLESTVVRVINDVCIILRPGKITKEDLLLVTNNVELDKHVFEKCVKDEKVLSPGMKYKHYAPNTKCMLVYSSNTNNMISKINEIITNTPNSLVISTSENKHFYDCKNILDIGSRYDLNEVSKNMFSILRKVDAFKVDLVIIEGVPKTGLGLAIMNRLLRTCEYNYVEC